jgi:glycerate kinase
MDAVGFDRRIAGADLCLTGEGRLDHSSMHGKTVAGVARACRAANVRCIAIAGSVERNVDYGFETVGIEDENISKEESMRNAPELIAAAAEGIVRNRI